MKINLYRKFALRSSLVGLIVMAAASLLFFLTVRSLVWKSTTESLDSLEGEIEQNVFSAVRSIDNTAKSIIQTESIKNYLFGDSDITSLSEFDRVVLKSNMEKDISRQLYFNPAFQEGFLDSIHLCLNEDDIVSRETYSRHAGLSGDDYSALYRSIVQESKSGMYLMASPFSADIVYFVYPLRSFGEGNKAVVLIIGTERAVLRQKYQTLLSQFPHARYRLTDASGLCIVGNTEGVGGGRKHDLVTNHLLYDGLLRSSFAISKRQITGTIMALIIPYVLLFLGVLAVIVCFIALFSSRFTLFSKDFIQHLEKVGDGDFTVVFPSYGDEELDRIGRTFNVMTEKINSLVEGVYKKQLLIQQMDIQLLQSQMNPHFLFNVLFSISMKAKADGDETLYQMVHCLTILLRNSLSSTNDLVVTIAQELEYVKAYLTIQTIRFEDRLSWNIFVDDALLSLSCPRLSIEPLVENAVIHGIEPLSRPGKVTVSARREGSVLCLVVEDDGAGFDPSTPVETHGEGKSNHIALKNLRQRIELLYGKGYGVTLTSAVGAGCKAEVRIPVVEKEESHVACDGGR